MDKGELDLIEKVVDVDWIEDHSIDAYTILSKLIADYRHLNYDMIVWKENAEFAKKLADALNKENKHLHKELSKYKKE